MFIEIIGLLMYSMQFDGQIQGAHQVAKKGSGIQYVSRVKSFTLVISFNSYNNPVINISDVSFTVSGVTGEQVARQISDTFQGIITNAYQRAYKK